MKPQDLQTTHPERQTGEGPRNQLMLIPLLRCGANAKCAALKQMQLPHRGTPIAAPHMAAPLAAPLSRAASAAPSLEVAKDQSRISNGSAKPQASKLKHQIVGPGRWERQVITTTDHTNRVSPTATPFKQFRDSNRESPKNIPARCTELEAGPYVSRELPVALIRRRKLRETLKQTRDCCRHSVCVGLVGYQRPAEKNTLCSRP